MGPTKHGMHMQFHMQNMDNHTNGYICTCAAISMVRSQTLQLESNLQWHLNHGALLKEFRIQTKYPRMIYQNQDMIIKASKIGR